MAEPECNETGKPACPVHYMKIGETSTECPSTEAQIDQGEPKAAPGNFCVYERQGNLEKLVISSPGRAFFGFPEHNEAGTTGAILLGAVNGGKGLAFAFGSWAVTAPASILQQASDSDRLQ